MNIELLKLQLEQAKTARDEDNFDLVESIAGAVLVALSDESESALPENQVIVTSLRADALQLLGFAEARRGNNVVALNHLTQALSFIDSVHDHSRAGTILNSIGLVHASLGSYNSALECYDKALTAFDEQRDTSGIARVTSNVGIVYRQIGSNDKALEYYERALSLYEELGEKSGIARVTGNIGSTYGYLGSYAKALEYLRTSLSTREELRDKAGVATAMGNIGNVYMYLGSYEQALEYYGKALEVREELGEKSGAALLTGNIGNVYSRLGFQDKALEHFGKALAMREELGERSGAALVAGNIGNVYSNLGYYEKALEYYSKSLAQREELGEESSVALSIGLIGSVYAKKDFNGFDAVKAEEYLQKAIAQCDELGLKGPQVQYLEELAELYGTLGDGMKAFECYKKYHQSEKEVQSAEAKKQLERLDFERKQAERDKDIAIAKTAADAKLSATTSLLHKVLPESIATRMIGGEGEISDYYTSVSILFADIASFTPISADMPAFMVVRFLNFVFKEFDRIMKKHGCEKVKTIGDGYMAVAGAPDICDDHAERIAAAALEMLHAIHLPDEIREYLPEGTTFGVRVGLHTGSVVAGVIGDERFVWDIYSDAVNTAARMESHGEPARIHVSSEFAGHLQQRLASSINLPHELTFIRRPEMDIKGKGTMQTFFLEKR